MTARPLPEEWARRWGAAFSEALGSLDEPDEARAAVAVDEALQAADEQLRAYARHVLLEEAKAALLAREREERSAKWRADEAARLAREGRKALEQTFGKRLARQVDPHGRYRVIHVGARGLYAVPDALAEQAEAALRNAGAAADLSAKAGPGYALARLVADLDGELVAVLTGDAAIEEAVTLARQDAAQRAEQAAAERKRAAEAAAAERRADEQRRTYGTTVDVD